MVLELLGELLQYMQDLLVATVYRLESVREAALGRIRGRAAVLAELRPVRQIRELPTQVQQLLWDLQQLSQLLLQMVVNTTPLYNMVGRPVTQGPLDASNRVWFSAAAAPFGPGGGGLPEPGGLPV